MYMQGNKTHESPIIFSALWKVSGRGHPADDQGNILDVIYFIGFYILLMIFIKAKPIFNVLISFSLKYSN